MDEALAGVPPPGCAAIVWRGVALETRCLTSTELADWYLPLRFEVLRRELGWTVGDVRTPADLRDAYDEGSIAFGVLRGGHQLIGAARLILPAGRDDLPSVRLLRSRGRGPGFARPIGEISRVMVRRDFRKLGLFRILLLSSLLVAYRARLRTLVISERDSTRSARVMANCGFVRCADGFSFTDEMIAPNEPAATYALDVHGILNADVRQAIAAHRDLLLRAAEAVMTGFSDRTARSEHDREKLQAFRTRLCDTINGNRAQLIRSK